jgi:hypothetical protein
VTKGGLDEETYLLSLIEKSFQCDLSTEQCWLDIFDSTKKNRFFIVRKAPTESRHRRAMMTNPPEMSIWMSEAYRSPTPPGTTYS